MTLRVTWITPHAPAPNTNGGAIRAYELLRGCADVHDVEVWQTGPAVPEGGLRIRPDAWRWYQPRQTAGTAGKIAAVVRPLPLPAWSATHELTRRAVEDAARGADLIVLDQHCAYGVVAALREARVPWVHIEHGIEWRLAASVARRAPTPYGVALNGSNAARYWWWERRIVRAATGVVAVSEADAAVFGGWGARRVHVAPNGTRIPDRPAHTPSPRPATRLLFLGSLDYWPNVDACRWLAADLMPAIRREMPAAVLTIVGRNPVAQVRRLHDPAAGVTVAGEVPDVRPWFGSSDVMLVPLRSGHGTKIKMIEAAAHGLPMVATRTADSGLEFGAAGAASVADGRSDFVAKAVELLADAGLRARMSERGRAVARDFDWDVIGERLAGWLAEVASPRVPAAVAPL